jgi:ribonuclease HI
VLAEHGERIGVTTANVAEYRAVIAALEGAAGLRLQRLELRLDSRLVVQQLRGVWTVRSPHLRTLYERVTELASRFERVAYRWVPREQNAVADAMVSRLLTESQRGCRLGM